jgi:hypothetical protein
MKFFHRRNPYLSRGWIIDVVLGGIVRISSSLLAGVTLLTMASSLYVVQKSSKRTLLSPTLGKNTRSNQTLRRSFINLPDLEAVT